MNVMDLLSLKEKVILVTGGAGKYGKSIAEGLAEAGASVIIASRNIESVQKVSESFRNDGLDVRAMQLDQADSHSVMKLKEQKVDGIVLDLRFNGGGSLYDVVQMAGLFVEQGPIVQVKDRDGKPQILPDHDKNVLYDGPFAVMVNELSASASEIFAAAIQDYHRGVIIGSTSTYGKGTVQRNIGLDKLARGPDGRM